MLLHFHDCLNQWSYPIGSLFVYGGRCKSWYEPFALSLVNLTGYIDAVDSLWLVDQIWFYQWDQGWQALDWFSIFLAFLLMLLTMMANLWQFALDDSPQVYQLPNGSYLLLLFRDFWLVFLMLAVIERSHCYRHLHWEYVAPDCLLVVRFPIVKFAFSGLCEDVRYHPTTAIGIRVYHRYQCRCRHRCHPRVKVVRNNGHETRSRRIQTHTDTDIEVKILKIQQHFTTSTRNSVCWKGWKLLDRESVNFPDHMYVRE